MEEKREDADEDEVKIVEEDEDEEREEMAHSQSLCVSLHPHQLSIPEDAGFIIIHG